MSSLPRIHKERLEVEAASAAPALKADLSVDADAASDPQLPPCPNGLFNFPKGSVLITDPDEEIFELYMSLASIQPRSQPTPSSKASATAGNTDHPEREEEDNDSQSGGLGFLDSNQSVLELTLDLTPPPRSSGSSENPESEERDTYQAKKGGGRSKRAGDKAKIKSGVGTSNSVESVSVSLMQDLGALKGRKGDTGSVLWRSSLHLARHLLSQHYHPQSSSPSSSSSSTHHEALLNPDYLSSCHILELGAGTGLLAILLSRLCASYTASDRFENLRLIQRNLELNGLVVGNKLSFMEGDHVGARDNAGASGQSQNHLSLAKALKGKKKLGHGTTTPTTHGVSANGNGKSVKLEEIDWLAITEERKRHPLDPIWTTLSGQKIAESQIHDERSVDRGRGRQGDQESGDSDGHNEYDLILAVDCIYNEHLVQPLVDTLSRYCPRGGKTVVWIVVELRSADTLTLFLETWMSDPSGPWTIVRLSESGMGGWEGKKARWVGWVGWR